MRELNELELDAVTGGVWTPPPRPTLPVEFPDPPPPRPGAPLQ